MVSTSKIPKKPTGRNRSRFTWWRRFQPHRYLPARRGLLARIKNGDFEYPALFEHARWELKWMEDDQKEFISKYQGRDYMGDSLYHDIGRKYIKRYNRLREDGHEMELRHLNTLVEDLCKEFDVHKDYVMKIMDTWDDTTESLYYHIVEDQGMNVDTYLKINNKKLKIK
jgi:hypothetical protein|tara:strand:+ start:128 stop:634 length:507 start_codon:yes stop_codon:yes gene_type:complete